jgi:hypothetical protein
VIRVIAFRSSTVTVENLSIIMLIASARKNLNLRENAAHLHQGLLEMHRM